MASADDDPATKPPDFRVSIEQSVAGLLDADKYLKFGKRVSAVLVEAFAGIVSKTLELAATIANTIAIGIVRGEDKASGAFSQLAATALEDVFGVRVDASAMGKRGNRGARTAAANAIGRSVLDALTHGGSGTPGGSLEPSAAGAEAYMTTVTQMGLEGWLEGWIVEALSLGQMETFGELDDIMAQVLGLGRMSRSVVRPLLDARVVTPFRWQTNRTYRPELLAAGVVAQQVARGRWSREQGIEELARQGWSNDRIEALFNQARKFFSAGDVRTFVDRGHWARDRGLQHLKDQGYEEEAASDAIRLEGLRRFDQLEAQEAGQIVASFAAREISRSDFDRLLREHVTSETERALFTELAELRQALSIKRLSSSEAAACVKAKILAFRDYRDALRREGYDEFAVDAKELLLRFEVDRDTSIEEHRRVAEAERAAEKLARAEAATKRRAEVEAERALRRRGSISDLERATIRGLIPFARLEEVLSAEYDPDTVAILRELVEEDRQRYLDEQQRAEDARKRAERRGLSIADLRAAVFAHLLTVQEFRARLDYAKLDGDDADLLTATMAADLADRDAAIDKRKDAEAAARRQSIDLGRLEQLVRRGARTMADYDALLASLGFDDASRAAMRELLQLHIDDDATARSARDARDRTLPPGTPTIETFRRMVLVRLKTEADFAAFLTSLDVGADLHALLVAELHDDVLSAEAARRRRDAPEAPAGSRALPLAVVARAARLGIVTVATYQRRLVLAGYSSDDVAIEMDLLVMEIADVQDARRRRDELESQLVAKGITLADVAAAVRAGTQTLEYYRGRAAAAGIAQVDIDLLTRVLADELSETKAARVRREQIASELDGKKVSLGVLEDQVRDGSLTLGAYVEQLVALGYALEDVELLATLLRDELEG